MPALTAREPGNGSGTLSYTLRSDSFDIESVYASIDATTATGPVTAELTVRDQSGVVIARKKQGVTIPAGAAGSATWALRLDDETTATTPAGSSEPWAIATAAGYIPDDWFIGRSPDPLSFANFAATPAAPFTFVTTNSPAVGDGNVTITSQGLYLVRLVVSSILRTAGSNPGYNWDMAVYAHGIDAGATPYFGPDLFHFGASVQPVQSYAFYLNPRNNFGSPNGISMRGRAEQHVSTESILNLPDSVVTWPVTISARAFHGLNDADIDVAPEYNLWLMRLGDSNPAAPTT